MAEPLPSRAEATKDRSAQVRWYWKLLTIAVASAAIWFIAPMLVAWAMIADLAGISGMPSSDHESNVGWLGRSVLGLLGAQLAILVAGVAWFLGVFRKR